MTSVVILATLALLVGALIRYFDQRERDLRAEQRTNLTLLAQQHAIDLERQHETHKLSIELVTNLVQFGTPERQAATTESREPGPEERVSRMIDEQTLARAKAAIAEEYRNIGVPLTDEEIDREARVLISGGTWSPPDTLKRLVSLDTEQPYHADMDMEVTDGGE